jgi:two-component system heavy metal sensor histidine kinase CusS
LLQSQLDEVNRLAALVDALSVLAKGDAGLPIVVREPTRFDEVVRAAVEDAQPLAQKEGVRFEITRCDPVQSAGDRAKLRQALLNLLDNAVKHNEPGGWVRIELRNSAGESILSLENTGQVIPPDLLPRIFDRFVRGTDGGEGSGLGLSIAKAIIEAHGGTVTCINRPEGGARFIISLPLLFS